MIAAIVRKTFTPGPWQVSGVRQKSDKYEGHMVGPDGDGVVLVPYNDNDHIECLANARLIAAAPELLDALRGLLAAKESVTIGLERELYAKWLPKARELIAKVDGGFA